MEVKFTKTFEKDLKAIKDKTVVLKVGEIIETLRLVYSLSNITGI